MVSKLPLLCDTELKNIYDHNDSRRCLKHHQRLSNDDPNSATKHRQLATVAVAGKGEAHKYFDHPITIVCVSPRQAARTLI
ncbi:hypothetical protein PR202_ga03903 [Eleusine coracana subsp. coracana]|uniref:Uncharacterized protein n=1 Tax=Eleusine coracana subsp. coracana TaxID=191504 RepID=A0AAV5BPR0_ELECO|nr:hypothetical protein PR202_ga03903 [Eleusine coracana subsp. coracana]